MVAPSLLECSRRRSTRSPDHMVRSRTPQGSRGTERVLEKLDVVNSSVSQLREEREGRRDFLAGLAPAIRERAEHRDLILLNQELARLERLVPPRPSNAFLSADHVL